MASYTLIRDLPGKIKALAVTRWNDNPNCTRVTKKYNEILEQSINSFQWDKTPEGHTFWANIYHHGKIPDYLKLSSTYEIC